ncbi:MAG: gfo/Idh/MocA family oxidoreductase [Planctomycetota bacterium]|nr:MAG: gfo/Idh/MocA family oxidoreductase [Planctomycetota bacterium]
MARRGGGHGQGGTADRMNRLRTALLGLADRGADYLDAVRADARLVLAAVGETQSAVRRRYEAELDVPFYEDHRSLVVETARKGLDLLIVTLPPHRTYEWLEPAVEAGVPVLMTPPPARTVSEARERIARMAAADRPFLLASCWRYEPFLRRIHDGAEWVGEPLQANVYIASAHAAGGWRGDLQRAGGGALLHDAYDMIDFLLERFGLPASVCARCGTTAEPGTVPNYDTEDAASMLLAFDRHRHAVLTVVRATAGFTWHARLVGTRAVADILPHRMTVTPHDGNRPRTYRRPRLGPVAAGLSVAIDVATGTSPAARLGDRPLDVLAVIEAAYLSARTGEPESPQRLLEREGVVASL